MVKWEVMLTRVVSMFSSFRDALSRAVYRLTTLQKSSCFSLSGILSMINIAALM
jgi:hypothetical protein